MLLSVVPIIFPPDTCKSPPIVKALNVVIERPHHSEEVEAHHINSVLQEALELLASDTEENRQQIAQETLEAIAIRTNK